MSVLRSTNAQWRQTGNGMTGNSAVQAGRILAERKSVKRSSNEGDQFLPPTMLTMASPNDSEAIEAWKDNLSIYPAQDVIAKALQDPGKEKVAKNKKGEIVQHRFPLIDSLAHTICKNTLKECRNTNSALGLTLNASRGKVTLHKELVLQRKHVDITDVSPFYLDCQKDNKVYLIANTPLHSGIDKAIASFQESVRVEQRKKNSCRTHNDGLRLACILLDPKCRGAVSSLMSKKKTRAAHDATGDPVLHFCEQILGECFLNADCKIDVPAKHLDFPEGERENWEPNFAGIFEQTRDASWLKDTCDDHLKKKHKNALNKWNKETGGGDGTPASFVDCCGTDRWLLWVFCLDRDANFLLAHSASGRMPKHMQVESGFEELSSMGSDNTTKREMELEKEIEKARKQQQSITDSLAEITGILKENREQRSDPELKCLEDVERFSRQLTDRRALDSMTDEERVKCETLLTKRRKPSLDSICDGA